MRTVAANEELTVEETVARVIAGVWGHRGAHTWRSMHREKQELFMDAAIAAVAAVRSYDKSVS
jgi:hypothetical protein